MSTYVVWTLSGGEVGQGRLIRRQENRGHVNQMMTPTNPPPQWPPHSRHRVSWVYRLDPGQDLTHTPGSKTKDPMLASAMLVPCVGLVAKTKRTETSGNIHEMVSAGARTITVQRWRAHIIKRGA